MIKAAAAVFAGNENDPRSLLFFLFIPVCDFRGAAPLLHVGRYLGVEDFVRIGRRLAALELIDHIHPANDLADHGVLAVEKRAVGEHDEELAVGRIRIARARHADHAARIGHVGELSLQVGIFRAAGAVAVLAVAGLCHESVDDAMEEDIVVEMIARKLLQPIDMICAEANARNRTRPFLLP